MRRFEVLQRPMGLEGRRALERARENLHRDHVANASKGKIFPQVRRETQSHSVRN